MGGPTASPASSAGISAIDLRVGAPLGGASSYGIFLCGPAFLQDVIFVRRVDADQTQKAIPETRTKPLKEPAVKPRVLKKLKFSGIEEKAPPAPSSRGWATLACYLKARFAGGRRRPRVKLNQFREACQSFPFCIVLGNKELGLFIRTTRSSKSRRDRYRTNQYDRSKKSRLRRGTN